MSSSRNVARNQPLMPPRPWLLCVDNCDSPKQRNAPPFAALPPCTVVLLLTHALPQALKLSPYMLATELLLEPGDRLQGRVFP